MRALTADEAQRYVCSVSGLTMADIRASQRFRRYVWPRQILMRLLREHTRLSTTQIGRRLGGRDHTTVLHGVRAINRALRRAPHRVFGFGILSREQRIELVKRVFEYQQTAWLDHGQL